ncbi:hypothetical protein WT33_21685 [Burkholderia stagnalis]|nr:hypothetical protein WT33_21685 [Burkholderia stagnalis]
MAGREGNSAAGGPARAVRSGIADFDGTQRRVTRLGHAVFASRSEPFEADELLLEQGVELIAIHVGLIGSILHKQ